LFTARFALTVSNLERLAALVRAIAATGCSVRLVLDGDVAQLTVEGEREALDRAAAMVRSTMDSRSGVPAQRL
jgi:fructose-1,6-bisphosphatase/sedoheptulose 1,7-bisphosphatase-like protein